MSDQMTDQREAISKAVAKINESWLAKRYEEIGAHVAEDAVIAPPESEERIRGRDAYVQSYRDYDEAAVTHEFTPGEPQVDVVGDVAVAVCPFLVAYELQGKAYRERGHDVLVFARSDGMWKVVWRTMWAQPADEDVA